MFRAASLIALALLAGPAFAQRATVIATCGTPPGTYAEGESRPLLQDTTGKLCVNNVATGGAYTSITGVPTNTLLGRNTAATGAAEALTAPFLKDVTTTAPGIYVGLTGDTVARISLGIDTTDIARIGFGPGGATARDTFIRRSAAATIQFGANDAAAPVAQTVGVQNVVAGTSNTAGVDFTINGSRGTGTGAGGKIILQTSAASTTGSTQNALAAALTINADSSINTTGRFIGTIAGALSAPGATLTGTWITGGSTTTTKPYVLIEPSGATSAAWSTNGTGLGVNAATGFTGNLIDAQLNGVARFSISSAGNLLVPGTLQTSGATVLAGNSGGQFAAGVAADVVLRRDAAAATWAFGAADAASPVAQTLNTQDVVAGTSNTAGVALTINGSRGTGTGAGGNIVLGTALPGSTGTTQNSTAAALTINSVAQAPQVNVGLVSALPICGASQEGAIRGVTDALAPTFLGVLTGGSSTHTPVYCNGTAWVSF